MPARNPSARLADIARQADVSLSVVSKVLNNRPGVADTTRARVERALYEHGYRRRRHTPLTATHIVELLLDDLSTPWSEEILSGVLAGLEHGYLPAVSARTNDDWDFGSWLEGVVRRRPAGVLIPLFEWSSHAEARLQQSGIPCVVIDPTGKTPDDVPTIGSNDYAGMREATQHLLAMGHRRIAFIGGPAYLRTAIARLDGFRSAMNQAKIPIDDRLVTAGEFRFEDGYANTRNILSGERPPTAILAASDMQAAGTYRAAWELGVVIPRDLSVVGFDDLPTSSLLVPPLTTVHHAVHEMAQLGATSLMGLIKGETSIATHIELTTKLIKRDSVSEPRETEGTFAPPGKA